MERVYDDELFPEQRTIIDITRRSANYRRLVNYLHRNNTQPQIRMRTFNNGNAQFVFFDGPVELFDDQRTNRNQNMLQFFMNMMLSEAAQLHPMEDVPTPLNNEQIDRLEKMQYSNLTEQMLGHEINPACVICQEDFKTDDEITLFPCKHYYHTNCIQPWISQYSKKCPTCREEINVENSTNEPTNLSNESMTDLSIPDMESVD